MENKEQELALKIVDRINRMKEFSNFYKYERILKIIEEYKQSVLLDSIEQKKKEEQVFNLQKYTDVAFFDDNYYIDGEKIPVRSDMVMCDDGDWVKYSDIKTLNKSLEKALSVAVAALESIEIMTLEPASIDEVRCARRSAILALEEINKIKGE